MKELRLVNDNKGIEFEGMAYIYKTKADAKKVKNDIETASKYCTVNIHKVLFDTCDEITDEIIVNA